MDYAGVGLYGLLKEKMNYLGQRQAVLARGLSMIDTPGYEAQDLKPFAYSGSAASFANELQMRITSSSHQSLGGTASGGKSYKPVTVKNPAETKPVKNTVTVEDQMMKINETAMDYTTATNLYGKMNMMFKTAIGAR